MVQQLIDFQKAVFNAGYNSVVILQGQGEQAAKRFLADMAFLGDTSGLDTLLLEMKKNRESYKQLCDDGFDTCTNMLKTLSLR